MAAGCRRAALVAATMECGPQTPGLNVTPCAELSCQDCECYLNKYSPAPPLLLAPTEPMSESQLMNDRSTASRLKALGSGARFLARAIGSRYNPLLAQVVVTRRCNLACGYCNEYDDFSPPVPLQDLLARVDHLASLKTASITFTGGEPLLHPDLDKVIRAARNHGMIVTMITNGFRLSRDWIDRLNDADLQGMQVSIDNLKPDEISMKSLRSVEGKLELLSKHARFKVNVNSVLGVSGE